MAHTSRPLLLALLSVWLAVVADALLRGASWGVNVALLALAVAGTGVWLARISPLRLPPAAKAFGTMAVGFASLFALRDSDALKAANGLALAFCVGAMLRAAGGRSLGDASFGSLLFAPLGRLFALPAAFFALIREARSTAAVPAASRRRLASVARGTALAVPILGVFGLLFAGADGLFKAKIEDAARLDLDLTALGAHAWTFAFALVLGGGFLYRISTREEAPAFIGPPVARGGKVGITEIGIVLVSINVLFAAFLAVQFRYLFGSREWVGRAAGLSYAEYARGGFFQLLWVAALALALLLAAEASLRRDAPWAESLYRGLGRTLVVMVFCVVASALKRMALYTDAFGLTELRVYSTVFMGWLTLAFAWMLATTLRGRPRSFGPGALAAGLLMVVATDLLNPDALIVRTNLVKPDADFAYLATLGDDAALAMRGLEGRVAPAQRQAVADLLERRRAAVAKSDWRELNLARWSLTR